MAELDWRFEQRAKRSGVGGSDLINKSHYLGAVYGMERIMGRARSPVRDVLDYASDHFLKDLPITYVLTVRARAADGKLVTRGLFAGDDAACYRRGAALCRAVNLDRLDRAPRTMVVYLDPRGFGGSQPSLAPAGRWRQAVNWWIIRGAGELELAPEKRVAAS